MTTFNRTIMILSILLAGAGAIAATIRIAGRSPDISEKVPSLSGATGWLNSPPLTTADLRGKVVLFDFWTYSCINWRRTLPYVRAWADRYKDQGLVVIGVHSPEFPFEKNIDNVRWAIGDMKIGFPVAIDNDMAVWQAFGNQYWPALYFVDAKGQIRHHQFGEGEYDQSEKVIQQLLAEAAGKSTIDRPARPGDRSASSGDRPASTDSLVLPKPVLSAQAVQSPQALMSPHALGAEVPADWANLQSPENYLGYGRTENFSSPGGAKEDRSQLYQAPTKFALNEWALTGNWTAGQGSVSSDRPNAQIVYRFHARDLHLVMGPAKPGTVIRFKITVDGKPPGDAHGFDCDKDGNGTITQQRMYQLIRQPGPIDDRLFRIEFIDPGAEAFSFTFG